MCDGLRCTSKQPAQYINTYPFPFIFKQKNTVLESVIHLISFTNTMKKNAMTLSLIWIRLENLSRIFFNEKLKLLTPTAATCFSNYNLCRGWNHTK